MNAIRAGLVSGSVALLLAGCSSSAGRADPNDSFVHTSLTAPAIGNTTTGSTLPAALPLDAYVDNDPADGDLLIEVNGLLTQKCMKGKGFGYQPARPNSASSTAPQPVYGITDLAHATRYGYGSSAGDGKSGVQSIDQQIAAHGVGWVIALYGGNYDGENPAAGPGCVDTAADPLYDAAYGDIDRSIVGELGNDALNRTEADPRVITLFQSWSSCMSAKGFVYPDPMHAAAQHWPVAAPATELATAVADVRCKQSTDLARIFSTIEAGYQQQLIAQNKPALDSFQVGYQKLIEQSKLSLAELEQPG